MNKHKNSNDQVVFAYGTETVDSMMRQRGVFDVKNMLDSLHDITIQSSACTKSATANNKNGDSNLKCAPQRSTTHALPQNRKRRDLGVIGLPPRCQRNDHASKEKMRLHMEALKKKAEALDQKTESEMKKECGRRRRYMRRKSLEAEERRPKKLRLATVPETGVLTIPELNNDILLRSSTGKGMEGHPSEAKPWLYQLGSDVVTTDSPRSIQSQRFSAKSA